MLCAYGCGKEAKFQMKNGKWCCSKSYQTCSYQKNKRSEIWKNVYLKNPNLSKEQSERMKGDNNPLRRFPEKNPMNFIENRIKISESMRGINNPNYNRKEASAHLIKFQKNNDMKKYALKGESHPWFNKLYEDSPAWKGGCIKIIRRRLIETNKKCCLCKSKYKLEMHHRDHNRENNDRSNLIILCRNCHRWWHNN